MKHRKGFTRVFSLVLALLLLVTSVGYSVLTACSRETAYNSSYTTETEVSTESESDSTDAQDASTDTAVDEGDEGASASSGSEAEATAVIAEDGSYTSKEDVALYINTYGHLPDNFITKSEAKKLGWEGGSLEPYAAGCSIGGDRFGNYEGLLPEADGRTYTECDIDTLGADSRGAKRIVFSNDGLVYYTDDHYESFTLLYGEE